MRVSPEIAQLVPYKPGKSIAEAEREYGIQDMTKLASNENSLGVSEVVKKAIAARLDQQFRYPDPSCYDLIHCVAELWKVPVAHIAIGNGSNEIIDLLIRIFCEPGQQILTTECAFVAYAVCAQAARVGVCQVPMKNWKIDLQAMAKVLREDKDHKIRLIFLPNPNNPTGAYITTSEVSEFLNEFSQNCERLIVFDEAYDEFVRAPDYRSALGQISESANVVVIRTLSKAYSLAGLRVGVLFAPTFVIDYFNRVRNPFNVNDLAQVAAVAALRDQEFVKKSVQMVWQGLDYFYKELEGLGLSYVPSQGNFVLFDTHRDAVAVNEALLRKGVILRPVLNYGLKTHLRMTVGLDSENKKAISALKEVISAIPLAVSRWKGPTHG